MAKQELDYLDRLFIEHYKGLKARKDIVVAPYEPDKQTGILQMDYDTKQHIHITLKFNKKNFMYNFRSDKHYQSMNQDKAFDFSRSVAEKYEGFRCNAYDDVMIIQHVGTYRDLKEADAIALLKQALDTFESTVMTELPEFEKFCEAVSVEDQNESSDLPDDNRREETSEYDIYALPESETESITDSDESEDYELVIDELLASFDDNKDEDLIVQPEAGYVLEEALSGKSVPEETVVPKMETVASCNPQSMMDYIKSYLNEKGIPVDKRGSKTSISAQFYDDQIRYTISYHAGTGTLKIQLSKKYSGKESIFCNVVENMKEQLYSAVTIKNGNILALYRAVKKCTPDLFDQSVNEMLKEMDRLEKRMQDADIHDAVSPSQGTEPMEEIPMEDVSEQELIQEQQEQFRQWENILKAKEEFLDGQKKEILESLNELNQRTRAVQEKEVELYGVRQQQEQLSAILQKKAEEMKKKESYLSEKEDSCIQKESILSQKTQDLAAKETELSAREISLKKERDQNNLERLYIEKTIKELTEERESANNYVQQMKIKAAALINQIRLLEKQKNDVADILELKTAQLSGGESFNKLEMQLTQLQQKLSESQEMLQAKDDKILSLEQRVKSQEERLLSENEKAKLQQDVNSFQKEKETYEQKLKEYLAALKKAKAAIDRLKEENSDLKAECDRLHNIDDEKPDVSNDLETDSDIQQDYIEKQIGATAEEFIDYICNEKGAKPEMIEEGHAEDGTLVTINGNIQILVSFRSGMNFVECSLDKHANAKVMKKIDVFNDAGKKSVIFTTSKQIICRTMFYGISVDEIYKIMEESADALAQF
ncbi:MAG: hypothetical protein MR936_16480 [Eubacterium sp.]|nr:hypothetical protein [Eubacterium sp.]